MIQAPGIKISLHARKINVRRKKRLPGKGIRSESILSMQPAKKSVKNSGRRPIQAIGKNIAEKTMKKLNAIEPFKPSETEKPGLQIQMQKWTHH